ncbi:MAG: PilT/PilU family type 4a pilus ATPase [Elusimicrobia bacterium]|nr:PilT/PilU family type 4a pilus ATPase [Elusimicrobiota bacterium]
MDVKQLLKLMVQREISDIHFKAGGVPALRIHGKMVAAANLAKLSPEDVRKIAYELMPPDQAKIFEERNELDLAYSLEGVSRFRVNVYRQRGTIGLTLRLIPLKVRSFGELHLPEEVFQRLAQESRGLILFSGITGAGKTTSMNCFLNYLNESLPYRIITVEDPIEYYHEDVKSSIVQREVGHDTKSFASALRHVLRQDPDVVVIGEMRDFETIQAAITAAETGHLVLSTIHTIDAVQTVDRIIDAYPAHQHAQIRQQLGNVLKGVIGQRLIASADGRSRFPACEVLIGNSMVRRYITEGKSQELYKAMESGGYYGMRTFDQDLLRLVQEGRIDQKGASEHATNPEDLALKFRGVSAGVNAAE